MESIRVTGLQRATADVIVSESRLQVGREYTEAELRSGAARVTRLPFVVRSELNLEKGTERGAYVLVINVTEAKPLFVGGVFRYHSDDTTAESDQYDEYITGGGRFLLGRSGVLHAAATTGEQRIVDFGYTHYDLFGRGAFAAAYLQYVQRENSIAQNDLSIEDQVSIQLLGGVPLRGDHGLRLSWTRIPLELNVRRPDAPYVKDHIATTELAWIYDSTDDPVVPTTGSTIFGGAYLRRAPFITLEPFQTSDPTRPTAIVRSVAHYRRPGINLQGYRHHEFRPRHTLVGGLVLLRQQGEASIGLDRVATTTKIWYADAKYAYTVWQRDMPGRIGDVQIEGGLRYYDRFFHVQGLGRPGAVQRFPRALVNVTLRNEWAVIRFNFDYRLSEDDGS